MAFNVNYSFNNGASTGTATNMTDLYNAIHNYSSLTQCTLSGTAEGSLSVLIAGLNRGPFNACTSLVNLDVSNLDVSNVTNLDGFCKTCTSLQNINLSNWNTSSVTSMNGTFNDCSALTSLNISSFDTSNVTDMSNMFNSCPNLEHIYVGENWNTDKVTSSSSMFYNSTKLPNYSSSYTDKTKAHYSTGGYLELAPTPTPTVPEIHIGNTIISAIKLGDTEISKIYLGTEEL